jgi:predicted amidophosphoribosyltransferase
MTHVCCPDCRLRFTPAGAAYLVACPRCGEPLQTLAGLERMVGFRVFRLEDVPHSLPEAVAVSIPIPDPGAGRP